jgi:glycosyltransferase involved in cell wall biosynthesis
MAAAKPVVATAVGGNPEVIVNPKVGYLVPPGDPGALAGEIIVLLQDPLLAHEIGKNSRARVIQHFSLSAMVNRYLMQYAELLGYE